MYIVDNQVVKPEDFVTEREILAKIFEVYPQIIYTVADISGYLMNPNHMALLLIEEKLPELFNRYFIEVIADGSFDYEYGDICSTHHCISTVGYVRRTEELEEIAIDDLWEYDYY